MRVRLTTNIGSRDRDRLGLKPPLSELMADQVVNVPEQQANELKRRGWAVDDFTSSAATQSTAETEG